MNTLWIFSGVVRGDFLDVHAAFAGGHQAGALRDAVHHHADVELLLDVGALLDQQPAHLLPARTGLVGDQLHAENCFGVLAFTSSRDFATLTPPPLPRPPAWICAFTTQTLPPSFFAASTASSTLKHGKPRGVTRPNLRNSSFPWYSCIFMVQEF